MLSNAGSMCYLQPSCLVSGIRPSLSETWLSRWDVCGVRKKGKLTKDLSHCLITFVVFLGGLFKAYNSGFGY